MLANTLITKGWPGRGGSSSFVADPSFLYVFGGADRVGAHFSDLLAVDVNNGISSTVTLTPAPPASGGHAAAFIDGGEDVTAPPSRSTFVIHGGVNFSEERAFDAITEITITRGSGCSTKTEATSCAIKPRGAVPEARTGHTLSPLPCTLVSADSVVCAAAAGLRCFLLFGGSSPTTGPINDVHLLVVVPLQSQLGSAAASGPEDASAAATAGPRFSYHWQQLATRGAAAEPREMHGAFMRPATEHTAATLAARDGAPGAPASSSYTPLHPDITAAVLAALRADGRIDKHVSTDGVAAVTPVLSPRAPAGAGSAAAAPAAALESGVAGAAGRAAAGCEPPALVIVGGRNADGGPQRDVCALDLCTLKWAPPARCSQAVTSAACGTVPCAVDTDVATGASSEPGSGSLVPDSMFRSSTGGFGWRHLAFGGWDGESGLSGDLLQLDSRITAAPASGSDASTGAVTAAASGGAGAGCASVSRPPASPADEASSATGAAAGGSSPPLVQVVASAPPLLRPSAWKWSSIDLRPRPTPAPRFAAAGAIVMLPGDSKAADGAGLGTATPSFALTCAGGMTAAGDLSEILVIRGT